MTKKIKWMCTVLALIILIAGSSIAYNQLSKNYKANNLTINSQAGSTDSPSNPAPDFTVIDREGNHVSLSDFKGKPVVLNFWASWCSPCKSEMPDFNEAYKNRKDVQFMMVNLTDNSRETVETAKAHIEKNGYEFPVFFDTEFSAAISYNTQSIPVTYFIDSNGNLVTGARGAIDAKTLESAINMITE